MRLIYGRAGDENDGRKIWCVDAGGGSERMRRMYAAIKYADSRHFLVAGWTASADTALCQFACCIGL